MSSLTINDIQFDIIKQTINKRYKELRSKTSVENYQCLLTHNTVCINMLEYLYNYFQDIWCDLLIISEQPHEKTQQYECHLCYMFSDTELESYKEHMKKCSVLFGNKTPLSFLKLLFRHSSKSRKLKERCNHFIKETIHAKQSSYSIVMISTKTCDLDQMRTYLELHKSYYLVACILFLQQKIHIDIIHFFTICLDDPQS